MSVDAPILNRVGVIADDLTGAADVASVLRSAGRRTVIVVGAEVPEGDLGAYDAIVVALKVRTAPPEQAVGEATKALGWLAEAGATRFFFKYCSTFDSTDRGNIGPVADALAAELGQEVTCFVPSYPVNGRTVYCANLFVHGVRLDESSMANHPLTPMRDANLVRVLRAQSRRRIAHLPYEVVRQGAEAVAEVLAGIDAGTHVIVDAITDADLATIAKALSASCFVTGGAAIAGPLYQKRRSVLSMPVIERGGHTLVLVGSCSEMTLRQLSKLDPSVPRLDFGPEELAAGTITIDELKAWVKNALHRGSAVVSASAEPDAVARAHQALGRETSAALVEEALSEVAASVADRTGLRIVVAGGDTSGAVMGALPQRTYVVGEDVAPGVPWLYGERNGHPRILLKSGNFGHETLFQELITK